MNSERLFLSPPDVGELEALAVSRAVNSGWVAPLGPEVDAFEEEMREYTGVRYSLAVSSGTAALHLALLSVGVKPGDIVLVPTMTFAATINAILYCGALPHFVDCEINTGNIDVSLLVKAFEEAAYTKRRISALISVDLFGKIIDVPGISEFCQKHEIPWISDSAESVGSKRGEIKSGNFSDVSVFSFNGNKVMTTSGGGMLLSNKPELIEISRHLSTQARVPAIHYEHDAVGFNYRMSNVLAALGRAQLSRLDSMISRRREIRRRYSMALSEIPGIKILGSESDEGDNCWLTGILFDTNLYSMTPAQINVSLEQENIETRPLWKPMHLQPIFNHFSSTLNGNSQTLFSTGIVLPSGSNMTDAQVEKVSSSLIRIFQ